MLWRSFLLLTFAASAIAQKPAFTVGWSVYAGWTPYHGVSVTGWPVGTFVRGRKVMWQGELAASSQGEAVRFLETMESST